MIGQDLGGGINQERVDISGEAEILQNQAGINHKTGEEHGQKE